MIVLGLDVCLNACSVAVVDGGELRARDAQVMARGHQERLGPMVRDVMGRSGVAFAELERIGVTVGPGSFTGLRVGLAFAKGLGQALGIPVVGVGTLQALAEATPGLAFAVIDARRDQVYLQAFDAGAALMAPDVLAVGTACARLAEIAAGRPATLVGSGAVLIAGAAPGARIVGADGADPVAVARLAAAGDPAIAPRPLYLRAPDARLPAA